jgi:Uma2 family endonuclease
VKGAPELLTEIALSSRSLDLHAKREDYARYGVKEYLVFALREKKLYWFDLQKDRELKIDADGICRVRTFPGLWIHVAALLRRDHKRLMRTLNRGLKSAEHAAFVSKLAAAQRKPRKRK